MGLKFAGRTDSRGARFLRGTASSSHSSLSARSAPSLSTLSGYAVLLLAAVCLAIALLRHSLGSPPQAPFFPVFATLPLVASRLAGQAPLPSSYKLAAAVFLFAALWYLAALLMQRRTWDFVFLTLFAFQLFFVFRFVNTFLPSAGPFSPLGLARPQKMTAATQLLALLLLAVWYSRKNTTGDETSGPSRVMSFLRRRRMPARFAGLLCMAITIAGTVYTAQIAGNMDNILLTPPLLFTLWLFLDALYFAGRTLWQRVH